MSAAWLMSTSTWGQWLHPDPLATLTPPGGIPGGPVGPWAPPRSSTVTRSSTSYSCEPIAARAATLGVFAGALLGTAGALLAALWTAVKVSSWNCSTSTLISASLPWTVLTVPWMRKTSLLKSVVS